MSVDEAMALRDVKNRLSEVVDQVEREHDRVVITRHGKAAAVVISTEDLASLEETLKVMSRPKLIAQVRDSIAEMAAGDVDVLNKETSSPHCVPDGGAVRGRMDGDDKARAAATSREGRDGRHRVHLRPTRE
ncbi:type II toxin-antitoxin system Phd/YefM family antitoxin [Ruania zhangjianzhongii]|uniref:type II toxin-antitoxin system Phd/YefM family antitoxin n=1 Tax=Ruania zhangjianzhongii TaxID=2603206 RepID=UPI0011CB08FC|nr:type II toxin-antitoxin system Phd/YefM family antitoxin [Ruania zhangjianzhongii]